MESLNDFLVRAAERTGFVREMHGEVKDLPVTVVPFFGDRRHEFFLSVFLQEEVSGYKIVAGLPGRGGLFGKVDEYWAVKDEGACGEIARGAFGWGSESQRAAHLEKQLTRFFDLREMSSFYEFGLKSKFFDKNEFLTVSLPGIPAMRTDMRLQGDRKVLVIPNRCVLVLRRGKPVRIQVNQKFYVALVDRLASEGFEPVILQNYGTYDISAIIGGKYSLFSKLKASDELTVARACECVLDLFAGDSRLAIMARAPYLVVAERQTYDGFKDYEAEDLVGSKLPNRHIFSFATMIESNEYGNVVDGILVKLKDFLPHLDRNQLPSTLPTSFAAPYLLVRERKMKKFGHRLFRLPKFEE